MTAAERLMRAVRGVQEVTALPGQPQERLERPGVLLRLDGGEFDGLVIPIADLKVAEVVEAVRLIDAGEPHAEPARRFFEACGAALAVAEGWGPADDAELMLLARDEDPRGRG